jgi:hypothetical protein
MAADVVLHPDGSGVGLLQIREDRQPPLMSASPIPEHRDPTVA